MLERTHSVSVPYAFPFPFCIRSVSILYPFRSVPVLYLFYAVLFLFCSRSICELSWNSFRRTGFLRNRIKDKRHSFASHEMVKTVALYMDTDNKLKFSWWKYEPSFSKKNGKMVLYSIKFQGQFGESVFPKRYKATSSLCDIPRRRSKPAGQALLTPSMKKCKQKTNFRLLDLHECF